MLSEQCCDPLRGNGWADVVQTPGALLDSVIGMSYSVNQHQNGVGIPCKCNGSGAGIGSGIALCHLSLIDVLLCGKIYQCPAKALRV